MQFGPGFNKFLRITKTSNNYVGTNMVMKACKCAPCCRPKEGGYVQVKKKKVAWLFLGA